MNQLGIGVVINMLGGNEETVKAVKQCVGKVIKDLALIDDHLVFTFDEFKVEFYDDGQSCCESRYMTTDDDISEFIGAIFNSVEIKETESIDTEFEEHEIEFLQFNTSKGDITFASHNEHNGYYGGFYVVAKIINY